MLSPLFSPLPVLSSRFPLLVLCWNQRMAMEGRKACPDDSGRHFQCSEKDRLRAKEMGEREPQRFKSSRPWKT